MKVLFRVDASAVMGIGHVMRCLTLARALTEVGGEVVFACRELKGSLCESIASEFPLLRLETNYLNECLEGPIKWSEDLALLKNQLGGRRFNWCVVDHYELDECWERGALVFAERLMVIDDLANRPHAASVLLNQNIAASVQDYAGYLPADCLMLLGPTYALLRNEFAFAYERSFPQRVRHILVSFGGADPSDETRKVLRALMGLRHVSIEVIAGAANPYTDSILAICAGQGWHASRHVHDMAARMCIADLCIGAGGTTSWERASLSLPTICIAVAENQQRNAELLDRYGAHCYLGLSAVVTETDIREAVMRLLPSPELRKSLARQSHALVDGLGAGRVCQVVRASNNVH